MIKGKTQLFAIIAITLLVACTEEPKIDIIALNERLIEKNTTEIVLLKSTLRVADVNEAQDKVKCNSDSISFSEKWSCSNSILYQLNKQKAINELTPELERTFQRLTAICSEAKDINNIKDIKNICEETLLTLNTQVQLFGSSGKLVGKK